MAETQPTDHTDNGVQDTPPARRAQIIATLKWIARDKDARLVALGVLLMVLGALNALGVLVGVLGAA